MIRTTGENTLGIFPIVQRPGLPQDVAIEMERRGGNGVTREIHQVLMKVVGLARGDWP